MQIDDKIHQAWLMIEETELFRENEEALIEMQWFLERMREFKNYAYYLNEQVKTGVSCPEKMKPRFRERFGTGEVTE